MRLRVSSGLSRGSGLRYVAATATMEMAAHIAIPPTFATGHSRSLADSQLQIEQHLRDQQRRILQDQFMRKVLAEGSFTPLEDMVLRLFEIAQARYAATFSQR